MDSTTLRVTSHGTDLPGLTKISDTIIFIIGVAAIATFLCIVACLTKYLLRFLRRHPKFCCSSAEEYPYNVHQESALARAIANNKAALVAAAEEGMMIKMNGRKPPSSQKCGLSPLTLCRNTSTVSSEVMSIGGPTRNVSETHLNGKLYEGKVDLNGNTPEQLGRDKGSESSDMPLLEYKR